MPILIVRLAEKSHVQAARLHLSTIAQREAEHADWPDELASALIANPSLNLSRWSESNGLTPWGVSRGFMRVFGLSPSAFRVRTRARKAWKAIQSEKAPLAAIASDLSFADQPHMTRSVKQLTGMGPQACRKAANGFKTTRNGHLELRICVAQLVSFSPSQLFLALVCSPVSQSAPLI
jgi:AraC-like DNA-binding protein